MELEFVGIATLAAGFVVAGLAVLGTRISVEEESRLPWMQAVGFRGWVSLFGLPDMVFGLGFLVYGFAVARALEAAFVLLAAAMLAFLWSSILVWTGEVIDEPLGGDEDEPPRESYAPVLDGMARELGGSLERSPGTEAAGSPVWVEPRHRLIHRPWYEAKVLVSLVVMLLIGWGLTYLMVLMAQQAAAAP